MPISSKVLLLLLVSFSTLHNKSVALAMATSPVRLEGQRVLVTGAGRGIGRSIALICSRHGAKVAIASRTRSELEETASLASDTAAAEAMEVLVAALEKKGRSASVKGGSSIGRAARQCLAEVGAARSKSTGRIIQRGAPSE